MTEENNEEDTIPDPVEEGVKEAEEEIKNSEEKPAKEEHSICRRLGV